MTLKYESEILAAYKRVGFTPRGRQIEYINSIVSAFLDEGNKNVVLSAPTGTGKSIIGVITSDVLHSIKEPSKFNGASFLLTATNALTEQYFESFDSNDDFLLLKGANNYECHAASTPSEYQTAETCTIQLFKKNGLDDIIQKYCNHCEYRSSRSRKETSRHVITNYSYFFIDRMYSSTPMSRRTLTVFDEAHLLNDLFTEHNAIYFSEKRLKAFSDEIAEHLKLGDTAVFKDLKMIRDGLIAGKITEDTFKDFLNVLLQVYQSVSSAFNLEATRNSRNQTAYLRYAKLAKKYENLSCKIDDFFIFDYSAVFEYKPKDAAKGQNEHECSVKPIFVGEMFEALDNAEFNLLMSATITKEFANKTLALPGNTKYIRLDPEFPKENKKIVFFKPQLLNYKTMQDPEVIKKLCLSACQIVNHHSKKNQRGIVLAPSFKVAESVAASLRNLGGVQVYEHVRGEKLVDILEYFKSHDQTKPAVLVTPSGYEGVDLPGELSRYQILLKHPFASLGDKRIKTILDQYPSIYSESALTKIVQGAGRSVRSPSDWAVTYCLDTATQRAWNSPLNEWKNEFTPSFSSLLED